MTDEDEMWLKPMSEWRGPNGERFSFVVVIQMVLDVVRLLATLALLGVIMWSI